MSSSASQQGPSALPSPGEAGSKSRFDIDQIRQILPQLVDSLSDALVVVDCFQRVVGANRRYLEAFGVRRVDVVGTRCFETMHCPEAPSGDSGRCPGCEVLASKQPATRVRSLPDAAGVQHRWETTFNPVRDADGNVTHVVEVWRDITDRSRLESQLSHSERLASMGLLAAGVAHEINNPMASVLAGVESLERWLERKEFDAPQLGEAREVLSLLEREARRCLETTDKLMLLAQPYSVAPKWVDLNAAVRDTLSLLHYATRKQQVEVREDLESDLPPVWAREGGMRGTCMNLIMNAVQAMPAGGTLTVRTRRVRDEAELVVEDTGPGISADHLDRIWDPFFTTKPAGQGTGLGLSITQRIVARHGGTIRVESTPGQGARFIARLPFAGPGGSGA